MLTTPDFALNKAVLLAHASDMAYQQPALIQAWARANGFGPAACFERENTQGFWTTSDYGVALLAFRGTANLGHWLRDARVLTTSHGWGSIHRGFGAGLFAVEQDLPGFDAAARNASHVWLTGHSLGGALAVIAAARLKAQGIDCRLITYGQPMVGIAAFAQTFDRQLAGRLVRIVNQKDIIARLPGIGRYVHCGQVKRLTPNSLQATGSALQLTELELPPVEEAEYLDLLQQLEENPELFETRGPELQGNFMPFGSRFVDHKLGQYIKHLETLLAREQRLNELN